MPDLRLSHVRCRATLVRMTSVAVLGLGRMGSAMAARLADLHDVRTWTRSGGGSPAASVRGADVVLLCLYDGPACRDVLAAVLARALRPGDRREHHHGRTGRGGGAGRPGGDDRGGVPARAGHGVDPCRRRGPADDPRRRQAVRRGRRGPGRCSARRWSSRARPRPPGSSSSPTACSATRWPRCAGPSLVVTHSVCRATRSSTWSGGRSSAGSSTAGATCWTRRRHGRRRRSPPVRWPRTSPCSRPPPTRCPTRVPRWPR